MSSARAMAARREDLAGVEELLRIEDALQVALQVDEIARLLERQVGGLRDADAVLAAQRAAEVEGRPHQELDRPIDARALAIVVPEKVYVEVAVARVTVSQVT